jgi:transcriptional regulator with XRE-family HTH domain
MERRGPLLGANRQKQELLLAMLRAVREEKGLNQAEVASAIAKPQSFVSKYEAERRRLDLLELKDVCDAIGIELVDFVRRFEDRLDALAEQSRSLPKPRTARSKARK